MKFFNDQDEPITETKGVDLGGQSIQLPTELADAIIAFRDETKNSSRSEIDSMKSQLDELVKEKTLSAQAAEKAQKEKEQLELAKKGELEALKESIASEWQDKMKAIEEERNQLVGKILDGEIKGAISQVENVNPDAVDDIFLRIKTANPELADDGIKVGDKPLADAVKEIVEAKDYYRIVNSPKGTGPSASPASTTDVGDNKSPLEKIAEGMGK